MEPEFKEGDIAVINPHVEAKANDYLGIRNDKEEATFKQLKIEVKQGSFIRSIRSILISNSRAGISIILSGRSLRRRRGIRILSLQRDIIEAENINHKKR
ncbi:MAG: S24 family peptidase [Nitrospirae bacterium]|nr:S24 family peptidase [Nitrospirota bacterium]